MAVDRHEIPAYQNALPGSLISIARSPHFDVALGFIAFEIVYFFAFRFAISFGPGSYSPLWFPTSILLCALLANRPERWWLFILGIVPIRILGQQNPDFPLWLAVANMAIDIAKALGAAIALRHFMRNPLRFDTPRDLAVFALFAVVLVPCLSASAGASLRASLGDEFWSVWARWFISDALTQLVVTPPILYWLLPASWTLKAFDARRITEAGLMALGLVAAGYWCMAGGSSTSFAETRFYAAIPLMFWAALRFGMAGATGSVAITAAFIVVCALLRDGPFTAMSPEEAAPALQNFLFLRSAPVYVIAALIEQRSAVERAIQDSEKRFRSMANSTPALLWMTGPDKLATFLNAAWLKFTGRPLEQELGNGWLEDVHPEDRQHCDEFWDAAFDARRPGEVEYRLRRHDGEYRWVLDQGLPRFAENGEFLGYIGSVLDITDRKEAEESNRALAHVQRLAIIGELTAAVAHELRQPSAAILSNAEAALALLESGEAPSDEIREIVADIRRANLRANEVLGHIQDFLRKKEARMEPLDLNAVVADVLLLVAGDARKRRVQIRTELHDGLPLVLGNRTHLQQVLLNLIVNGMDAMSDTPNGESRITIRTATNGNGHVEVAVADCGSGVPSSSLPRLFESFFTTRADGMGLGLSIARSIIESHNGRIWADNNDGGGATFRFTMQSVQRPAAAAE
jgi:PAS domain S-box-containing protein